MINLSDGYAPPPESSKFDPGDVIQHLRYGYRGVIVDFDPSCQAPDHWYQSNQTQPDRNQAWVSCISRWQSTSYICCRIKPKLRSIWTPGGARYAQPLFFWLQ